ncbi:MAG: SRPBCC domain-containing protein [Chloroflexi bacterium]|nr:SRPBCC domain-containing protein [Chloroflexota bacterium]
MKTKTIRQSATFKTTPHQVYEALMDSKKHSEFTGSQAKISRKAGGKFTVYEGDIEGINIELVPDKKIVQTWRYIDWPADHYSRVTFSLEEVETGTRLTFVQTDVPEEHYNDISEGWREYYWRPMKAMLRKKS